MKEKVKVQENGILDFGWTFYIVDRKDTQMLWGFCLFLGFFLLVLFLRNEYFGCYQCAFLAVALYIYVE